jgi:hypothetical protein
MPIRRRIPPFPPIKQTQNCRITPSPTEIIIIYSATIILPVLSLLLRFDIRNCYSYVYNIIIDSYSLDTTIPLKMCMPSNAATNDSTDSAFKEVQEESSGPTQPEGISVAISDRYHCHPSGAISYRSLGTIVLVALAGTYHRYCASHELDHLPHPSTVTSPSSSSSSSSPADICTDFQRLEIYLSNPAMVVVVFVIILLHLPTNWRERIEAALQHLFKSVRSWTSHSHNNNNLKRSGGSHSRALSTLSRVTSVDTFKKMSKNLLNSLDNSCYSALQSITRKECFARSDYIERLSVNDVAILFRYACNVHFMNSHSGITTDKSKFLAEQSPIVRAVITAMDMAVKVSRGCLEGCGKASASSSSSSQQQQEQHQQQIQLQSPDDMGDIDALYFVAATRIFAEWRTLRLVPKGYQRYAVALSLAYRDVLQNLEKMERGVHAYLRHHQSMATQNSKASDTLATAPAPVTISSPTLRQLLQFELDTLVHKKLPYLAEKSSASGLLWTKRQLHYQTATFNNMLEVPVYYPTPKDAAQAAYRVVYNEYHGWAIQQIFAHGFGGSPPLDTLWANLDPPLDLPESSSNSKPHNNSGNNYKAKMPVTRSNQYGHERRRQQTKGGDQSPSLHSFDEPPERKLSDVTDGNLARSAGSDRSESCNHYEEDNALLRAWENMGRGVAEKWEDALRLFNCGGAEEKRKNKHNLILSSESHFNLNQLAMDSGVANEFLQQHQSDDDGATAVTASTQSSSSSSSESSCNDRYDGMVDPVTTAQPQPRRQPSRSPIIRSQQDTEDFVRVVSPMIADLGKLLDEFNMNDPSRV